MRITLDYQAIGILEGDTVMWFWIGRPTIMSIFSRKHNRYC
jgi:hypothetical protein